MNNRTLLIIFITCLLLFFGGRFLKDKRSASFDPVITALDTNRIDRIKFVTGGPEKKEFELVRKGESWEAIEGERKVSVQTSTLKGILNPLANLTAERVVSKDPEKYATYEIDDAQASKVIVWQDGKQAAELVVGGFRFNQQAQSASTFVRKGGKPEVYVIDGFAGIGLKARFDQFRDKKLVKTQADDLTSLEWKNTAGHIQKIQKEDGTWYYAGMEAVDSTKFNNYIAGLVNAQGSSFSELTSPQGLTLAEQLTLYGNNMADPTVISVYHSQDTLAPFLINSTANPEALFNSDSSGLYKQIFTDLRQFWPDGQ